MREDQIVPTIKRNQTICGREIYARLPLGIGDLIADYGWFGGSGHNRRSDGSDGFRAVRREMFIAAIVPE
jgi:hypothetical protein